MTSGGRKGKAAHSPNQEDAEVECDDKADDSASQRLQIKNTRDTKGTRRREEKIRGRNAFFFSVSR